MGLTTMMDLVLKHVQQQAVAPFALNASIAVYPYDTAERGLGQGLADGDQSLVDGRLLALQISHRCARLPVRPCLGTERATFEAVDVEPIDNQNMIQRCLKAWEEASAWRLEFPLRQLCARAKEAMIRPCIVAGHGA